MYNISVGDKDMKKGIIKILTLSFILIIISSIIVISFGKTYKVVFDIKDNTNNELTISNDTGKVKVLDEKKRR